MTVSRSQRSGTKTPPKSATGSLDLGLRLLEYLASSSQSASLGALAKAFSASKATVYRRLRALIEQEFVHQDVHTGNYEIGIKILILAESARARFDIVRTARDELIALRDKTQQAATLCCMLQNSLVVLDLVQGYTIVDFGTRPGTRLDLKASAHGKVWRAFHLAGKSNAATAGEAGRKPAPLPAELLKVRRQGWATSANRVVDGVNALAAPVFDHRGVMAGSVAIVGATQFIGPEPTRAQIEAVVGTARRISQALGWKLP